MRTNIFFIGLLALTVGMVSCAKKITPADITKARQTRLEWNLKTLVEAYEDVGNTDSRWDELATNALIEFAKSRSLAAQGEDWATIIATNCEAAVNAGCDDPMVRYLYIKFAMNQTNSPKDFSDAFCKVEADMQQSGYPPIRKFYASLRAQEQLYYAFPTNYDRQLASDLAQHINENLADVVADKSTPPEEVYEASSETLDQMSGSAWWYTNCFNQIEKPLFANWPDESTTWLLKGEAEIKLAWFARGSGYSDTVSKEGWKLFGEHLTKAETALNRAWKLNPDPRIAVKMIWVELGRGQGRDRMELWFKRAMSIDPNDYDACNSKLLYIEPKWYGSIQDMLNFGRECVQNTNWGGRIPLVLVNAHLDIAEQYTDKSEQTNYWKQPEVWADIKSAYDRCFQINPNATDLYYYYARFAYRAEDWNKLNELLPKLGKTINYDFFGGKDAFDKMVRLAKEHASQSDQSH